jgi:hypothetical protein
MLHRNQLTFRKSRSTPLLSPSRPRLPSHQRPTNTQAFKEAPGLPWTRRTRETRMVLKPMTVPQAIEGSTNTKADRSPQVRRINASHRISVTDGASVFVGGQWGCGFRRAIEGVAGDAGNDEML